MRALNTKDDKKKGQSVLEYAVLLLAVCIVFISMFVYMQRSVKAKLYNVQTQINQAVR